jgi:hypothetical protein
MSYVYIKNSILQSITNSISSTAFISCPATRKQGTIHGY